MMMMMLWWFQYHFFLHVMWKTMFHPSRILWFFLHQAMKDLHIFWHIHFPLTSLQFPLLVWGAIASLQHLFFHHPNFYLLLAILAPFLNRSISKLVMSLILTKDEKCIKMSKWDQEHKFWYIQHYSSGFLASQVWWEMNQKHDAFNQPSFANTHPSSFITIVSTILEQIISLSFSITSGCAEMTYHFKKSGWETNFILVTNHLQCLVPLPKMSMKPFQLHVFLEGIHHLLVSKCFHLYFGWWWFSSCNNLLHF